MKIYFMRHAETSLEGEDKKRPLTEKGKREAMQLKEQLQCPFDLIVSSSARRAIETAECFSGEGLEVLTELYLPAGSDDRKEVERMLDQLGSVPLKEYLEHDPKGSWKRYCDEAHEALEGLIQKKKPQNLLVVAHANIINYLGMKLNPAAKELYATYFLPCSGFWVR